ncbi:MAG: peptide MFS transporter [Deltaproteobacteria bacterium]|nr:peptide MFS transporter [Deltaproteobacteria bacterium]MBW2531186.1 peptide MFS transporter [Deltaproteobacteria bacterium]
MSESDAKATDSDEGANGVEAEPEDARDEGTDGIEEPGSSKHPKALPILFFAEMWERFCFYGMRTLLTLYMVRHFQYSDDLAYGIYGSYNSLVYLTPILGGLLADRLLGYRRSIVMGGVFMAVGMFMLLIQNELFFYGGMAVIIVGNGYFKPNISTLLGKLYKEGDPKRDAGFQIFYMGINIGALTSTLICGYIGENWGWTYGFGLAGIGMICGLLVFGYGRKHLHGHGEIPEQKAYKKWALPVLAASVLVIPVISLMLQHHSVVLYLLIAAALGILGYFLYVSFKEDLAQRHKIWVLLVLWVFHSIFWSFFEQAGTSLTLFTARNVDRDLSGWEFPATWGQFFNPLFIVLLTPVFAMLWPYLSRVKKNPSIPNKFSLGLLQIGVGFGALVLAAGFATEGLVPIAFLIICYFFHTTGELCLSPVGLSAVTKLAPPRMTGLAMGAWFLSISMAHKIAGGIAALTGAAGVKTEGAGEKAAAATDTLGVYVGVFTQIAYVAVGAAVLLFLLSFLLKRWLHGVE